MTQSDIVKRSGRLASLQLREEVSEERSFPFGNCRYSIWRNVRSKPSIPIGICASESETIAATDFEAFARILKLAQPSLSELCNDAVLLRWVLPAGRSPLPIGESSYIDGKTGHRLRPTMQNGSLVFYCNNYHSGRVLKVGVSPTYEVTIEDLGEGIEMDLL